MSHDETHLLICGCKARVPVAKGQAGGRVRCPECGAAIDVPRLREFGRLAVVTAGPQPRQRWDASRGTLLAASAVAVGAGVAAVVLVSWASRASGSLSDPDAIRAAMAAADTVEVHRGWQRLAEWGIMRPPSDAERRQQAVIAAAESTAMALRVVSGIGAVVAVAACWSVLRVAAAARGLGGSSAPRGERRG